MTHEEGKKAKKPVVTGKGIVGMTLILIGLFLGMDAVWSYIDQPVSWLGNSLLGVYACQAIIGIFFFGGGLHLWQNR